MLRVTRFDLSKKAVWGAAARLAVLAVGLGTVSCGEMVRQGTGSSFLIIEELNNAATLQSDVITMVTVSGQQVPTIVSDTVQAQFRLGFKDPDAPTSPTQAITIDRYRVTFIRADGRNTPGVDVPYGFDSAFTLTVSGTASGAFTLVRHTAKQEAPLQALGTSPVVISTIAEITFFGRDQAGREVSVTGRMGVEFGNFADSQ
jgi:hypothetical protein